MVAHGHGITVSCVFRHNCGLGRLEKRKLSTSVISCKCLHSAEENLAYACAHLLMSFLSPSCVSFLATFSLQQGTSLEWRDHLIFPLFPEILCQPPLRVSLLTSGWCLLRCFHKPAQFCEKGREGEQPWAATTAQRASDFSVLSLHPPD